MAPRKNTKEHILNVVEGLCAEVGPQRLQHATVAKELGIKPPSLYAHFPSMQAMLEAVSRRALGEILNCYQGLDESKGPLEALNQVLFKQVDLLVARPGIARLVLFDLSQPGGTDAIGWQTPEIVKITEVEQRFFQDGVAQGDIADRDFFLWFSQRMGALYVSLSYEWLRHGTISEKRVQLLKSSLALK